MTSNALAPIPTIYHDRGGWRLGYRADTLSMRGLVLLPSESSSLLTTLLFVGSRGLFAQETMTSWEASRWASLVWTIHCGRGGFRLVLSLMQESKVTPLPPQFAILLLVTPFSTDN